MADAVQVSTVYTDTYTPIRAMVTLYALYSWQDGETTRYTTQPQNKVCPSEAFSDLDVTPVVSMSRSTICWKRA